MLSYCSNYLATMPDITVYMNCDTRLAINLSIFELGDDDEFIFAIKNYSYIDSSYVFLFRARKEDMDEHGDDKCISVVASAPALIENFNRELDVSDLREMFGDHYKDPYTGYYTYRTIKNGGELVFSLDYGELNSDCWISYTKLGCADIRTATAAMEQWGNSWEFRDLYVAPDFEYPYRTETELRLLSITYQQLDGNGYTCEARDLVLRSSNGKTYTAYGVTDNWGNVYDLSITFDCHAMRLDWTITQSGEYADFSFEPWIAYYLY